MHYKLEGKLAFVTGSTKSIGKATAALLRRLARSLAAQGIEHAGVLG
jgi:NAD(P)-dependent dehydrogenase (short-subunit alcohol dehydrogenase family)